MGIGLVKGKRGQVSIEFILIVLIALIYIYSVIQPTVLTASQSTEDVTRLSEAKFAAQKLAGAISQLQASSGEGKKTITLYVPKNSSVECLGDRVIFSAIMSNLKKPPQCIVSPCEYGCADRTCKGFVKLLGGAIPTCDFGGQTKIDTTAADGQSIFKEVLVKKDVTGIVACFKGSPTCG